MEYFSSAVYFHTCSSVKGRRRPVELVYPSQGKRKVTWLLGSGNWKSDGGTSWLHITSTQQGLPWTWRTSTAY